MWWFCWLIDCLHCKLFKCVNIKNSQSYYIEFKCTKSFPAYFISISHPKSNHNLDYMVESYQTDALTLTVSISNLHRSWDTVFSIIIIFEDLLLLFQRCCSAISGDTIHSIRDDPRDASTVKHKHKVETSNLSRSTSLNLTWTFQMIF